MMSDMSKHDEQQHWYALWVYRSLAAPVISLCRKCGARTYQLIRTTEHLTGNEVEYREENIMPNLLFAKTTAEDVLAIRRLSNNRAMPYCYPGTSEPAPIDDITMEMFMLTVRRGARGVEPVDIPIDKGDRVRVTDGIFKGAEGYIRRVHGSRRFVVAIQGVVAVAVTHIPRQFLEPASEPPQTA